MSETDKSKTEAKRESQDNRIPENIENSPRIGDNKSCHRACQSLNKSFRKLWGAFAGLLEASWRRPERSWKPLDQFWSLEPSWSRPQPSWGSLGALLTPFGTILNPLEPSWRRLGAILSHLGTHLSPLGDVLEDLGGVLEASSSNYTAFSMNFIVFFSTYFDGFSGPSNALNLIKLWDWKAQL